MTCFDARTVGHYSDVLTDNEDPFLPDDVAVERLAREFQILMTDLGLNGRSARTSSTKFGADTKEARLTGVFRASLLAAAFLLTGQVEAETITGERLDRSKLVMTFSDDFKAPISFFDAKTGRGRWKANFDFGDQEGTSSRTLSAEEEIYASPAFDGVNPFVPVHGQFAITATRNPDPTGKPYLSGLLTTSTSFQQAYGYFEIEARLPQGSGLWPAFWLAVPLDPAISAPQFPGEIDVMEMLGKDPQTIYCSAHWPVNRQASRSIYKTLPVRIGSSTEARRYGVLWTRQTLTWFVDDREVAQIRNPGLHRAMVILVNLAVGGQWGGPATNATKFPARMVIDYIHAYRLAS